MTLTYSLPYNTLPFTLTAKPPPRKLTSRRASKPRKLAPHVRNRTRWWIKEGPRISTPIQDPSSRSPFTERCSALKRNKLWGSSSNRRNIREVGSHKQRTTVEPERKALRGRQQTEGCEIHTVFIGAPRHMTLPPPNPYMAFRRFSSSLLLPLFARVVRGHLSRHLGPPFRVMSKPSRSLAANRTAFRDACARSEVVGWFLDSHRAVETVSRPWAGLLFPAFIRGPVRWSPFLRVVGMRAGDFYSRSFGRSLLPSWWQFDDRGTWRASPTSPSTTGHRALEFSPHGAETFLSAGKFVKRFSGTGDEGGAFCLSPLFGTNLWSGVNL